MTRQSRLEPEERELQMGRSATAARDRSVRLAPKCGPKPSDPSELSHDEVFELSDSCDTMERKL